MDEKQDATPSGPQATNAEPQYAQIICSDEAKKLGGITGKGWMPGKSGNPNGRPKKAPMADASREILLALAPGDPQGRTYAQVIAERLAMMARNGDVEAFRALADRAEGKPRQTLGIENDVLRSAFESMSEQEKLEYAREGKLPAWFPAGETNVLSQ